MKLLSWLRNSAKKWKLRQNLAQFPLLINAVGCSSYQRQALLAQSRELDQLQLVHAPAKWENSAFIYSIPLGDILGNLDESTTALLRRMLGDGFCVDGEIFRVEKIDGKYLLSVLVYDSSEFLKGEIVPFVNE